MDGKLLAAICHAPWVLVLARVVQNRRASDARMKAGRWFCLSGFCLLLLLAVGCTTKNAAVITPTGPAVAAVVDTPPAIQAALPTLPAQPTATAALPLSSLGEQVTALSQWMEPPLTVPCNEVAARMNVKEQDPLLFEPSLPLDMAQEKCFYGFAPRPTDHRYQHLLVWLWYAPPQGHATGSGSWHHFALVLYPNDSKFKTFLAGNRHYANPDDINALFYLGEELNRTYPYEIQAVKGWWEVDGAMIMKLVPRVDWVSKDILP